MAQRIGKELEAMQQRLEQLLDQAMDRHTTGLAKANSKWHPPVDAYETEEEFVVLVAIAGMSKEAIQITFQEPDLRIWGTRSASPHPGKVKYHQMEINFGPFERIIRIGSPVQAEKIHAQYKDGFLTIYIPKNLNRKIIKVRQEE